MAVSTVSTIAVTGANGFLGLAIVKQLLVSNHCVRAIARKGEGITIIRNEPSLQVHLNSGLLTTTMVRDDEHAVDAYQKAFDGVHYVVHTAAPLLFDPGDHIKPAVKLTIDILRAIEACKSVSRLVVTGSMASIKPWQRLLRPGHPDYVEAESAEQAPVLTSETTTSDPATIPSSDRPPFERYTASKILVHNILQSYIKLHPNSHFSIVAILPGMIMGAKLSAKDKQDGLMCSNSMLAFLFRPFPQGRWVGLDASTPYAMFTETVAMSDVVDTHIRALDFDVKSDRFRSFLLSASWRNGFKWAEVDEVAKALYLEGVLNKVVRVGDAPGLFYYILDVGCA